MFVNLSVSDFSGNFFTLDQDNKPTNGDLFLKGLNALASQALGALSKLEDVELAFQRIERVNLIELTSEDKKTVDQRIQDVLNKWVKVSCGNHFRYVPRERLAKQCGPKFQAQYTSEMKEATDRELNLQFIEPSSTDSYPEECKELLLVHLQTGALPPEALGDNALNMLALAEQHQMEELTQECLDFLIDNLSLENLETFLEFTQQTPLPPLELACLNFMKDNGDSISEDLKTKYQEELSMVESLAKGKITLAISSSGKIEAVVRAFTEQTADSLETTNKQFPISSLIFQETGRDNLFSVLEQIAPILEHLQELFTWNETPIDNDLPKLKNLFPNLKALGKNAPFLKTFEEVKTYVKNFRKPGEDDQESKKPLLRSLNLKAVPNLTDAQLEELTPYLQELYHLYIESDKITSVVAPKATWVICNNCAALTTLEAPKATFVNCERCKALTAVIVPKATTVYCSDCTKLTTLETPKATSVDCKGCTKLTTLEAPKAITVNCSGCTKLTTLEMPEASRVDCKSCTALTMLNAPEAIRVDCCECTALTALKTPEATEVFCFICTQLTTLKAPKATSVNSYGCTELKTLRAPEATKVYCGGCTALTTLEAPKAITVNSTGCTKLTALETPEAIWVYCCDCTALTTLEAPEATEIDCKGCTKLTALEMPGAIRVDCSYCTALTTLEAPKAITVHSRDCTALTTFNAPIATEIDCRRCTALKTLDAPKA